MSKENWANDWKETIYHKVAALGFDDITAFATSAPGVPYRKLVRKLGDEIAPVQIEKMLREELIAKGNQSFFARDCLARYLAQYLPGGWAANSTHDFYTARAFAAWSAALSLEPNEMTRENTRRVWNIVHQIAAPGWNVAGAEDPVLIRAFEGLDFSDI
jgi:hypothetical protein